MKTKLTLEMEKTLYETCLEAGNVVVEEVTMPDDQGIVDTLSYQRLPDGKTDWRCYELKVTKSDFHSKAKLSFIGNYNYFVLPLALYHELAAEIPAEIGVLSYQAYDEAQLATATEPVLAPGYLTVEKKPRYQELALDETALMDHFLYSLAREVRKAKRVETGISQYGTERLYKELKKRHQHYDIYNPADNFYARFIDETRSSAVTALQEEVDALNFEIAKLQQQLTKGAPK
ncbi:hypothetical protein FD04_GL001803 [Secundilactobacillus odoratitofui DSM 19909 = JCM 15043]|uniref:Uncharacterized protein n=1 Tax=Secundilactobacillus odoratitofui DSM 19909 = JCM 15043 TaxID=1423776 RepID=A0A0R1LTQ8_9LACO|nr:hypothetical protein [Secundilactobacillus odoratitofui]KRK96947.1 hypothetical protein FD04_GL001803 [Secundilactobacillus odoratitofui DSM 19909 = JCM 15043]